MRLVTIFFLLLILNANTILAQQGFQQINNVDCELCEEITGEMPYESMRLAFKNGDALNNNPYRKMFDRNEHIGVFAKTTGPGFNLDLIPLFMYNRDGRVFETQSFSGKNIYLNVKTQGQARTLSVTHDKFKRNRLAELLIDLYSSVSTLAENSAISPTIGLKDFAERLKNKINTTTSITTTLTIESYDWADKDIHPTQATVHFIDPNDSQFIGQFDLNKVKVSDPINPIAKYSVNGRWEELPFPYLVIIKGRSNYKSDLLDTSIPSVALSDYIVDNNKLQLMKSAFELHKSSFSNDQRQLEEHLLRLADFYVNSDENVDQFNRFFNDLRKIPVNGENVLYQTKFKDIRERMIQKIKNKSIYVNDLDNMFNLLGLPNWNFDQMLSATTFLRGNSDNQDVQSTFIYQRVLERKAKEDDKFFKINISELISSLKIEIQNPDLTSQQVASISEQISSLNTQYSAYSTGWADLFKDLEDLLNYHVNDSAVREALSTTKRNILALILELEELIQTLNKNLTTIKEQVEIFRNTDSFRAQILEKMSDIVEGYKSQVNTKIREAKGQVALLDESLRNSQNLDDQDLEIIISNSQTLTNDIKSFNSSLEERLDGDGVYLRELTISNSPKYVTAVKGVRLRYCSPQLKGRNVNDIIKLSSWWRFGANESTIIAFDDSVQIGNQKLMSGTYAIRAKREQDNFGIYTWRLMFHPQWESWGAEELNPNQASVIVPATQSSISRQEDFKIDLKEIDDSTVHMEVSWGDFLLYIRIISN